MIENEQQCTHEWTNKPGELKVTCTHCGAEGVVAIKVNFTPPKKEKPPCEGFRWLGQDFAHCEECGRDISLHKGLAWLRPGASPFNGKRGDLAERIIIPFDEARRRIPLFALHVTPIDAPEDYAGPYRYDKADGWVTE